MFSASSSSRDRLISSILVLLGLLLHNGAVAADLSAINACPRTPCEARSSAARLPSDMVLMDLGERKFAGPRRYFGAPSKVASFIWWHHRPIAADDPTDPELRSLLASGQSGQVKIILWLSLEDKTPEKNHYLEIERAIAEGGIQFDRRIRNGLRVVQLKGPGKTGLGVPDYYIATDFVGVNGLPPVVACYPAAGNNLASAKFYSKNRIWVVVTMARKNCADWPEIYIESNRIVELLEEIK